MRELTRDELLDYRKTFLTVGQLKEMLAEHNYSDDAIIVVERVHDEYYEGIDISGFSGCTETKDGIYPEGSKGTAWGVYLKGGDSYQHCKAHNKKIDSGELLDKDRYPNIKPETLKKYTEEELHLMQTQYHPVFGPAVYYEEKEIVFLNLHY